LRSTCHLNGYDLRKLPLIERKTHLKKIIEGTDLQFSGSFEVDGPEMHAHACTIGLEGVVSKVRDSRYASGRGSDWLKKPAQRETLTIAGFARDGRVGRLSTGEGKVLLYAGRSTMVSTKCSQPRSGTRRGHAQTNPA